MPVPQPDRSKGKKPTAPEKPGADMLRVELQQTFDESVKGKVAAVDNTRFMSTIPGVDHILTVVPRTKPGQETPSSLNVTVGFTDDHGKRGTSTLTLTRDGQLIGSLNPALKERGVTHLDVLEELMSHLEQMNLKKWIVIEGLGLKSGGMGSIFDDEPGAGREAGKEKGPEAFDEERLKNLEMLIGQPDALLGLKDERPLYDADHTIVFEDFLMIENLRMNHAIYFLDIPHIELKDIPKGKEEIKAWLETQEWFGLLKGSRKELRERGAVKKVHTGEWQERVMQEIEERRKKEAPEQGG